MKNRTLLKSFRVLAVSGLLATGTAEAGMGPCMAGAATPPCAGGQGDRPACAVPVARAEGGAACAPGNAQMMDAMGNMAAGGIGIAAQVMRTLMQEANRYLAPGQAF